LLRLDEFRISEYDTFSKSNPNKIQRKQFYAYPSESKIAHTQLLFKIWAANWITVIAEFKKFEKLGDNSTMYSSERNTKTSRSTFFVYNSRGNLSHPSVKSRQFSDNTYGQRLRKEALKVKVAEKELCAAKSKLKPLKSDPITLSALQKSIENNFPNALKFSRRKLKKTSERKFPPLPKQQLSGRELLLESIRKQNFTLKPTETIVKDCIPKGLILI